MTVLGVGGGIGLIGASQHAASLAQDASWPEVLASAVGLRVTRVDVRGTRFTQPSEVVRALQLPAVASQLSLDMGPMRRRVEGLPWVRSAKLQRILPDGLAVEIVERVPAMVWRRDEGDALVDMDGRVLSTVPRGGELGLPVVAGDGAGAAGPDLLLLLRLHPQIERRLVEALRVEGRRWTLLLSNGTHLHLPADGAAAALAWVDDQAGQGLLDRGHEAIDLRVPGQLVVRAGRARLARDGGGDRLMGGAP